MTRFVFIVLAILAALVVGFVVLFTLGAAPAVLVAVLVLVFGTYASGKEGRGGIALRSIVTGLFVLGLLAIGAGTLTLIDAFTDVSAPVAPADEGSLASAHEKLDAVGDDAAFRMEIHEAELSAVAQDGMAGAGAPFRHIELDITEDAVAFAAESRNGELILRGQFEIQLVTGVPEIEIVEVDLGIVNVPGIARGAVEDFINPFISDALGGEGIEIQSLELGHDSLVVTGTQVGGEIITSDAFLRSLRAETAPRAATPAGRLGPGIVNGTTADGPVYYVALGDSLAANVGVAQARDGYVSRFHRQLQERDQTQYGLRNIGASGETSASLIRSGQLQTALEFIRSHEVRYITINIGANDLLGHLTSADCSEAVTSPACQKRIDDSFAAYEANLTHILAALREAAPDAEIIFLQTYNPFSLGYESRVAFERESNRVISEFNELAAQTAQSHAVLVADGFTPLKGMTAVTTHILDDPPDIHPREVGFDLLASALVEALP